MSGASLHDIGAVTGHKSDTATARYIRGNRKRDAEMAELSTKISAMGAPAADTAESRCVASETVESGARFVVQQQQPAMVRHGMDLQMLGPPYLERSTTANFTCTFPAGRNMSKNGTISRRV